MAVLEGGCSFFFCKVPRKETDVSSLQHAPHLTSTAGSIRSPMAIICPHQWQGFSLLARLHRCAIGEVSSVQF